MPQEVATKMHEYAFDKGKLDIGTTSTAEKQAMLDSQIQKFMDQYSTKGETPVTTAVRPGEINQPSAFSDPTVQGPYSAIESSMQPTTIYTPLSVSDLLNVKEVAGNEANWLRGKVGSPDPSRMGEFALQGESAAARDLANQIMTRQGEPGMLANLKHQQDQLGVLQALKDRAGSASQIRSLSEVGAIAANPIKGAQYTALIEAIKNPRVMGYTGLAAEKAMSPNLWRMMMLSDRTNQSVPSNSAQ
jgi:hypothetical protein